MIWLLIGYMWLFIHRPFEIWTVLATYRIERVYMLITIAWWFATGPRLPTGNRLHRCFASFILVMLLSWLLSPYASAGDNTVENYLKYSVFYVLLVTSVRTQRELRTVIVGHAAAVTLLIAHSLREYFNGRVDFAQGIVRLVPVGGSYDYNDLAGLIVCSMPLTWVLWQSWTGLWNRAVLLGHFGLAGYSVMLTGSRMGFLGMTLASVLACLTSSRRWRLLAVYPAALAALWLILPQDRRDRYMTLIDSNAGPAAATRSAANFRYGGFEKAIPLFEERPLIGLGPNSFGLATGKGMMAHNLYGQLLAELGLAGVFTFGLILWGIGKNTLEARRILSFIDDDSGGNLGNASGLLAWRTVLGASAAVLLLAIMGWGFNFLFWHVWLWFGGFQVVALQLLKREIAAVHQSREYFEFETHTAHLQESEHI